MFRSTTRCKTGAPAGRRNRPGTNCGRRAASTSRRMSHDSRTRLKPIIEVALRPRENDRVARAARCFRIGWSKSTAWPPTSVGEVDLQKRRRPSRSHDLFGGVGRVAGRAGRRLAVWLVECECRSTCAQSRLARCVAAGRCNRRSSDLQPSGTFGLYNSNLSLAKSPQVGSVVGGLGRESRMSAGGDSRRRADARHYRRNSTGGSQRRANRRTRPANWRSIR